MIILRGRLSLWRLIVQWPVSGCRSHLDTGDNSSGIPRGGILVGTGDETQRGLWNSFLVLLMTRSRWKTQHGISVPLTPVQ